MVGWIKKQDTIICCLQETHLGSKDKHKLQVKGWKMMLQANCSQKKAGIATLTSDKIDFKPKKVTIDNGQYIMIKWTIHQEDITVINIYAPNIRTTKIQKANINRFKRRN